jgi:hypothetical protein
MTLNVRGAHSESSTLTEKGSCATIMGRPLSRMLAVAIRRNYPRHQFRMRNSAGPIVREDTTTAGAQVEQKVSGVITSYLPRPQPNSNLLSFLEQRCGSVYSHDGGTFESPERAAF